MNELFNKLSRFSFLVASSFIAVFTYVWVSLKEYGSPLELLQYFSIEDYAMFAYPWFMESMTMIGVTFLVFALIKFIFDISDVLFLIDGESFFNDYLSSKDKNKYLSENYKKAPYISLVCVFSLFATSFFGLEIISALISLIVIPSLVSMAFEYISKTKKLIFDKRTLLLGTYLLLMAKIGSVAALEDKNVPTLDKNIIAFDYNEYEYVEDVDFQKIFDGKNYIIIKDNQGEIIPIAKTNEMNYRFIPRDKNGVLISQLY